MEKTILVVDDEAHIQELIKFNLTKNGFKVITADNGIDALKIAEDEKPDLIFLDLMLPGMDGLEVCKSIRKKSSIESTPIIMITAKGEELDKILGLELGADDYITKPFNPLELIARVKSQLRRYVTLGNFNKEEEKEVLKSGGLELNTKNKEVFVDGESIKLTPIEFKILELLLKNKGRVFSMEEIYERVWNETSYNVDNTVAVHIRRIREKIEINPKEPKYLKVVWGIGYKIDKC